MLLPFNNNFIRQRCTHFKNSPVSEDRCGVPRLISRLPILDEGPLLLSLRGLDDGLDTLAEFVVNSSCDTIAACGKRPLIRAAVAPPLVDGFDVESRRLRRPGEEQNGIPGSDGARRRRCCWRYWWDGDCPVEQEDGDPVADPELDGNGPTDMDVDLRLLRSPLVG